MYKLVLAIVLSFSSCAPAFAEIREEQALIVKAVTNGKFPLANYELTAEIPCYAIHSEISKQGGGLTYQLGVVYTWDYEPGRFYCRSISLKEFRTTIVSEIPPTVKIINAAPGVSWEIIH